MVFSQQMLMWTHNECRAQTWASQVKLWVVNFNRSSKLLNLCLVLTEGYDGYINQLALWLVDSH